MSRFEVVADTLYTPWMVCGIELAHETVHQIQEGSVFCHPDGV